jgi:hypothetical protein
MAKRRLPVGRTIIAAYRDLGRLLSAMPALMLSAFVIILAIAAGAELVPQRLWDQESPRSPSERPAQWLHGRWPIAQ